MNVHSNKIKKISLKLTFDARIRKKLLKRTKRLILFLDTDDLIYIYKAKKCLWFRLYERASRKNHWRYQKILFQRPTLEFILKCHRLIQFDLRGHLRLLEAIIPTKHARRAHTRARARFTCQQKTLQMSALIRI